MRGETYHFLLIFDGVARDARGEANIEIEATIRAPGGGTQSIHEAPRIPADVALPNLDVLLRFDPGDAAGPYVLEDIRVRDAISGQAIAVTAPPVVLR